MYHSDAMTRSTHLVVWVDPFTTHHLHSLILPAVTCFRSWKWHSHGEAGVQALHLQQRVSHLLQ
jgi:hypothetical protein